VAERPARTLHDWGADVVGVLDRGPDEIADVPRQQLGILEQIGVEVVGEPPTGPEVIVDALIGYGVRGDPVGRTADLNEWALTARTDAAVISLDGPSGLGLTTGLPGDPTVIASATVTLALPKTGLLEPSARPVVSRLFVADIGVPPEAYEHIGLGRIHPFSSSSIIEVSFQQG
jgi:NAD(P)H-hydrate epimerase